MNADSTLWLCQQIRKPSSEKPSASTALVVIRQGDGEIVYRDQVENGQVEWYAPQQLLYRLEPGTQELGNSSRNKYLYDLQLGKKVQLSSNNH